MDEQYVVRVWHFINTLKHMNKLSWKLRGGDIGGSERSGSTEFTSRLTITPSITPLTHTHTSLNHSYIPIWTENTEIELCVWISAWVVCACIQRMCMRPDLCIHESGYMTFTSSKNVTTCREHRDVPCGDGRNSDWSAWPACSEKSGGSITFHSLIREWT